MPAASTTVANNTATIDLIDYSFSEIPRRRERSSSVEIIESTGGPPSEAAIQLKLIERRRRLAGRRVSREQNSGTSQSDRGVRAQLPPRDVIVIDSDSDTNEAGPSVPRRITVDLTFGDGAISLTTEARGSRQPRSNSNMAVAPFVPQRPQRSHATTRRRRETSPDIRVNNQALPFEASLFGDDARPNLSQRLHTPPARLPGSILPTPDAVGRGLLSSRHLPEPVPWYNPGHVPHTFGGALLSAQTRGRQVHAPLYHRMRWNHLTDSVQSIFGGVFRGWSTFYADADDNEANFVRWATDSGWTTDVPNRPVEDPDYLPQYTHPREAPPGFSNDLASQKTTITILGDGPSGQPTEEPKSIAVCARCLSSLVTNGTDQDGNRLYGLRCGHLIDAKCFMELSVPKPTISADKALDKKGKAKAKAISFGTIDEKSDGGDITDEYLPVQTRSQRRGGRGRGSATRARGRKRAGGRGKGRNKQPNIVARHEWNCPVTSCSKTHISLLFEGVTVWKPDPDHGAIALFI